MDPFLGQIMMVGFNFAPRGWALCDGQILPINSYQALFSLLGTTFGGDGRTTFALPDLRGRSPVHVGSGPGLDTITWGERSGRISVNLAVANMPSHNHTLSGTSATSDAALPTGNSLAQPSEDIYASGSPTRINMHSSSIGNVGSGQSFNIRNPFLGVYFCIALQGTFPSRN